MAPKKSAAAAPSPAVPVQAPATTTTPSTAATTSSSSSVPSKSGNPKSVPAVLQHTIVSVISQYQKKTPQRTKLIDVFLAFLAVVGALQFVYCILAGNYPFNAFLSGFSATVGQFVLTVSLRIQTNEANKSEFPSVSPERSFADYVVGSLILHFFCINFIN
ncbi:DAD family-domain-containing protein [Microdochium trichocladiopsis]|uniref:Dolichyl-diphosphooligosaccharide--protein glycosyltransferase subunit OST2 n=1 Tax=Microdochium trichocladiopsis TaxID=1682393 RepID=A0A9P8YBK7_9PEZI|nr:DAD family-domain-containing protein [Microdochium trichocladiopsis]KAH7034945.1 DAD family-domain-containing protein [Microdochium trichocladiopsis]